MNITEIKPLEDFTLWVKSDSNQCGIFDVRPYLDYEVFLPLKNKKEFDQVRHGRYFIEWHCGADLSADTVFAEWQPIVESPSSPINSN